MWDLPGLGIELMFPALAGGLLTTAEVLPAKFPSPGPGVTDSHQSFSSQGARHLLSNAFPHHPT